MYPARFLFGTISPIPKPSGLPPYLFQHEASVIMAPKLDVVDHGKPFSDEGCYYQWSWHWLDADFVVFDDDGNEKIKCRYGEFYRKLTAAGINVHQCMLPKCNLAIFTWPIYIFHLQWSLHPDPLQATEICPVMNSSHFSFLSVLYFYMI